MDVKLKSKKYHRLKWLKCSKKKWFIFMIFYAICIVYIINKIKRLIYAEDVDCRIYKDNIIDYSLHLKTMFNVPQLLNNISIPKKLNERENWFQVAQHVFVYSVYYTKCPSSFKFLHCVQFIGITLNGTNSISDNIKCAFRNNSTLTLGSSAFIQRLDEGHFLPYTAAFFYCDLKSLMNSSLPPNQATIYDYSPSKWLTVEGTNFTESFEAVSVSLCVRPFYGQFSNFDLYLIQFLAYYTEMGVDNFIFYHYHTGDYVHRLLSLLSSTHPNISIFPWDMPLNLSEVHEYGQIAFTQDCLARTRYKYTHTIIVDLDEFIVPKKYRNIVDLVKYLDKNYPYAGSYNVPMVLFCEEFPPVRNDSLPILNRNKRQKSPWPYRYRTKYIAIPRRIKSGGVHFVWQFEDDYSEVVLSPSIALLHHYKHCCGMIQPWFFHLVQFPVLSDDIVVDESLISHAHEILSYKLLN